MWQEPDKFTAETIADIDQIGPAHVERDRPGKHSHIYF